MQHVTVECITASHQTLRYRVCADYVCRVSEDLDHTQKLSDNLHEILNRWRELLAVRVTSITNDIVTRAYHQKKKSDKEILGR